MPAFRSGILFVVFMLCSVSAQARPLVGSVALYSNGDVEKLIAYHGDRAVWEDVRKRRYTLSTNPLIPVLQRQDLLHPENDYRVLVQEGRPKALLGAAAGKSMQFTLQRTYNNDRSISRYWQCTSLGKASMSLDRKALRIDRYSCVRAKDRDGNSPVIREQRILGYAPALGLVADLERTTTSGKEKRTLVHLLGPKRADADTIKSLFLQIKQVNSQ